MYLPSHRFVRAALMLVACAGFRAAYAQVPGELIVYGNAQANGHNMANRFDRRLKLRNSVDLQPTGVVGLDDGSPVAWGADVNTDGVRIVLDPLHNKKLVHLLPSGALLPSVPLDYNPVRISSSKSGIQFVLTRIPLLAWGPAYAITPSGSPLWVNWAGPNTFTLIYPDQITVTPAGHLWIGGESTGLPTSPTTAPVMRRLDPATGNVVQSYFPPASGASGPLIYQTFVHAMSASPDGTIWGTTESTFPSIFRTDGTSTLNYFPCMGTYNGSCWQLRVDGSGDCWTVSRNNDAGNFGQLLYRYGVASGPEGTLLDTVDAGGLVVSFAIGTSGREIYAETVNIKTGPPFIWELARINLETKVVSSVALTPNWFNNYLADGDPNGFIYANTIHRDADSDGDGFANGAETAARSDPYDALSQPGGPRVDLWFAESNNAIHLRYVDPDGVLDPNGGIDPATLSLVAGTYGEIFPVLLQFVSNFSLSPDGTEAVIEFGHLPIPKHLKIPLDVRVRDYTGKEGWDWQVTPPGKL